MVRRDIEHFITTMQLVSQPVVLREDPIVGPDVFLARGAGQHVLLGHVHPVLQNGFQYLHSAFGRYVKVQDHINCRAAEEWLEGLDPPECKQLVVDVDSSLMKLFAVA